MQHITSVLPRGYIWKKNAFEPSGPSGRSLSRFPKEEATRIISTPLGWDAGYRRVTPSINSFVPIYTLGWREAPWESNVLPKNTTQWSRPGLEPGPLDPESSAQTRSPLVGEDVGTCNRHTLHHTGYTKNYTLRIVDSQRAGLSSLSLISSLFLRLVYTGLIFRLRSPSCLRTEFANFVQSKSILRFLNTPCFLQILRFLNGNQLEKIPYRALSNVNPMASMWWPHILWVLKLSMPLGEKVTCFIFLVYEIREWISNRTRYIAWNPSFLHPSLYHVMYCPISVQRN